MRQSQEELCGSLSGCFLQFEKIIHRTTLASLVLSFFEFLAALAFAVLMNFNVFNLFSSFLFAHSFKN